MSHTVSGQSWQTAPDLNDAPNFETGEGIPAWALKVEGRLLEVSCAHHTRFIISLKLAPKSIRTNEVKTGPRCESSRHS